MFQGWMLDNLVVPVASQFGMEDEYAYLKTSIARFPTGEFWVHNLQNWGPHVWYLHI
jgi:demethylmenaquinone methyltransferase/2-methoxy-6-polyprenyl-1,4-benzoquinol methylase